MDEQYVGFRTKGHAEYAEHGQDVVCAAVSILVENAINSIETFAQDDFQCEIQEKKGAVIYEITSRPISTTAQLLLKSLVLGLKGIEDQYGKKYLKVHFKKKQEV